MLELDAIHQGDCIEVMRGMPDNSVDLGITSPPYPGNNKHWSELYYPENWKEAHEFLSEVWDQYLRILKPGCKLIINIANTKRRPYLPNTYKIYDWALGKCEPLGEIIWHKGYGQCGTAWGSYCNPSDPSLADQHEYLLVFRKYGDREKRPGYHLSARDFKSWRNSIWNISPEKASKIGHVAPFPEEIPKRLILLYSYENEVILDAFCGSGTTCKMALIHDRHYIGIDISEEYCNIARQRVADAKMIKDSQPELFEVSYANTTDT